MAVQLEYVAPQGWQPENPDQNYLITSLKVELANGVPESAFRDATGTIAAESSTGTWTNVESGPGSGMGRAEKYRALAYDLDPVNKTFKIAYPVDLFELNNMSGLLAGIVGNIAGMKMIKGLRVFDVRFPEKIVNAFPGPAFGVEGIREFLGVQDVPLLGTVPKPKIGRSAEEQAALAYRLFTAGDGTYNFIKDDENLTSLEFNRFEERVKLVLEAQKKAEKATGKKKLYLCNITHSNIEEMKRRAELIKANGGYCFMLDCVTTGFAAVETMRRLNTGLFIHAHRAMHGFITRESGPGVSGTGPLHGFSISMLVLGKIFRLLGVDSIHTGSPKAKMEDYNESDYLTKVLQTEDSPFAEGRPSLGQKWFGLKRVWATASGGLHPASMDTVIEHMGRDIYIQMGGGVLGHPKGAERGVEAALQARDAVKAGKTIQDFVKANPDSALAEAAAYWGFGPKIVY